MRLSRAAAVAAAVGFPAVAIADSSVPAQVSATTAASRTTQTTTAASDSPSSTSSASNKPNIIIILTDDQDLHLGSLNTMSNVQSMLIQQGLTFNRHYCPTSLCCPARATLWTGKYAHNTNVTSVRNSVAGGAWKQIQRLGYYKDTLPSWLQAAGYNTYYGGKIYNGISTKNYCDPHCPEGWTMGDFLLDPRMYSYYNSTWVHLNSNGTWGKAKKIEGYSTDQISADMLTYIDDAIAADKPFMAVAAPVACHMSGGVRYHQLGLSKSRKYYPYPIPKKEYWDLYPDLTLPKPPNFNPANRSGVAGVWKLEPLEDENLKLLEDYYRLRQQALKSVDDMVGDIVSYLEEKDILDNTYIIYTSDNGFHIGNHRLQAGKEQCFEEDINVPFIVRGPGVAKNQTTDLVTGHIDLTPTILQLANASLDHPIDGAPISFPLETQADFDRNFAERGDFINVEFWGPFNQEGPYGHVGVDFKVNVQTYKAIRIHGNDVNLMYSVWCQDGAHELYDMSVDPYQMTNLHPQAPGQFAGGFNSYELGYNTLYGRPTEEVINRLDALVLVGKTCIGEICRHPYLQLHPGGNVTSLMEALDPKWDSFYQNSYKHAKVGWETCYTGYSANHSATLYSLANEQPVWLNPQIVEMVRRGNAATSLAAPASKVLLTLAAAWTGALVLL